MVPETPEAFRATIFEKIDEYDILARLFEPLITSCSTATFADIGMDDCDLAEFALAVAEIAEVDLSGDALPELSMTFASFHAHCVQVQADDARQAKEVAARRAANV